MSDTMRWRSATCQYVSGNDGRRLQPMQKVIQQNARVEDGQGARGQSLKQTPYELVNAQNTHRHIKCQVRERQADGPTDDHYDVLPQNSRGPLGVFLFLPR
jgi:hypothetical protein